jgi:NHL repeat
MNCPCRVVFLSLSLAFLSSQAAALEPPPRRLRQWGEYGHMPGQLDDLRGIAVDHDGNVLLIDRSRFQKFSPDGVFLFLVNRGMAGSLDSPSYIAVDADGHILLAETESNRIQVFDNAGTPLSIWGKDYNGTNFVFPRELVAGKNIYLRSGDSIFKLSASGELIAQWEASMATLALGPDDNVYEGREGWFLKYSPDGALLGRIGDESAGSVMRFAIDSNGYYFTTWAGTINVFDETGRLRVSWEKHTDIQGIVFDSHGHLFVADAGSHTVTEYGVLPTFPPIVTKSSAVMLHIAPPVPSGNACALTLASSTDIVTRANASRDGSARYFVYLLASPEQFVGAPEEEQPGLAGLQLGIDYKERKDPQDGLHIFSWQSCSDLEWRQDTWPEPGSGNTITWVAPENCNKNPIVVAGYFYVAAYSPSFLAVTGYPTTDLVKTATCSAAESIPDRAIGFDRVGWVSVGGGAIGADTDGCNPLLEPCVSQPVAANPTSWGQLKSKFISKQ